VVVCDDIRQEKTEKFILIGVYAGSIIMNELPNLLKLSFWLLIDTRENNDTNFEFRGMMKNEKSPLFSGRVSSSSEFDSMIPIHIGPTLLNLVNEGELQLQWRPNLYRWETIHRVQIKRNQNPPAATS
jgi:hypothetical protein